MSKLKDDVASLIISYFGKETGEVISRYYDEDDSKEILKMAKDMLTKLLGAANAEKQLSSIYEKYSIKG